jgi:hypothetical protein
MIHHHYMTGKFKYVLNKEISGFDALKPEGKGREIENGDTKPTAWYVSFVYPGPEWCSLAWVLGKSLLTLDGKFCEISKERERETETEKGKVVEE